MLSNFRLSLKAEYTFFYTITTFWGLKIIYAESTKYLCIYNDMLTEYCRFLCFRVVVLLKI